MRNKFLRGLSSLLILILLTGSLFSLTSCSILADVLANAIGGDENSGGESGESGGGDESQIPGESGGEDGEEGGSSEGTPPDYYPGSIDPDSVNGAYKSLLSVVRIVANHKKYSGYDYDYTNDTQIYPYIVNGSGVIYKLDKDAGNAYVITNYHVVYHKDSVMRGGVSEDIEIYLYGQENERYKIRAEYVGGSLTQDLAVLRINGSDVLRNSNAKEADIRSSDSVMLMEKVIAIGNPEGMGLSVTSGIVSVDSEWLKMVGADNRTSLNLRVMRISAAINEGNSGGGLFDGSGRLIGIVNAKRTGSDVDNIAYAIPIDLAKNISDSIIYHCDGDAVTSFSKCLLGVTIDSKSLGLIVDGESGAIIKAEEVVVSAVDQNSVLSGKLGVNDIITAVKVDAEMINVTRKHHVTDHMLKAREGSEITLYVTRGEYNLSVTVTVTADMFVTVN